ncbi:MAG: hypothetical protein M3Y71_14495 [Actinomycetota bacterium]|nr:hypothetical protein [Actinomycetota bacterium]
MTAPPTPTTSWEEILDRLELEIARAHSCLVSGTVPELEPWEAPVTSGPVPPDLAQRAHHLADRQEQLALEIDRALHQTRDALTRTGREQALAAQVRTATTSAPSPVYLDVVT